MIERRCRSLRDIRLERCSTPSDEKLGRARGIQGAFNTGKNAGGPSGECNVN
jgi:hypothetical protein